MQGLIPINDVQRRFKRWIRTWLPFQEPLLEPLGSRVPTFYKPFSLLYIRLGYLRVRPFDLGDGHLLAGAIHKKIGVTHVRQLDGQLLHLLGGVMVECFGALANLAGCPIHESCSSTPARARRSPTAPRSSPA